MLAQRLGTWRYILTNTNLPPGVSADFISKWLVITRASVFSMTATSGLIGGLLAIGAARLGQGTQVQYGYLALAIEGDHQDLSPRAIRSGPSGSWPRPSSTPAGPGACWSWG